MTAEAAAVATKNGLCNWLLGELSPASDCVCAQVCYEKMVWDKRLSLMYSTLISSLQSKKQSTCLATERSIYQLIDYTINTAPKFLFKITEKMIIQDKHFWSAENYSGRLWSPFHSWFPDSGFLENFKHLMHTSIQSATFLFKEQQKQKKKR